jgi:hypothetical protein
MAAVATHPDDAAVATPAGTMRLIDYLPSRVFELVVHTDDVARALGVQHEADLASRTVATTFLAGIVAEADDSDLVLRALTGRGTLPTGFTAL